MRLGFWAMAGLLLVTYDQTVIAASEATWTGSLGRLVADSGDLEALEFVDQDGAGTASGRLSLVTVNDGHADRAARLETLSQSSAMESLQMRLATIGDIDDESTCWLHVEARAVEPQVELGLARLSISVRSTEAVPLLDRSIYLEPAWTPIDLTFVAPADFDAGDVTVVFAVGTQLQVIDIASVSMRCFDDERMIERLPSTSFSYAGREPEAPWRGAAQSQIERYRKGDLTVEVTDESGQPVADAEIHIQMARHAFQFGTLIDPDRLTGEKASVSEDKTASYRKILKELFNTVTLDRGLRWTAWADPDERQATEDALAWVRSLGLGLRGQGLVPTSRQDLPAALQEEGVDKDSIREAINAGVTTTAGELEGRIQAWDVVDRPHDERDLLDLIGWGQLANWYQLARSAAPDAELMLNEGGILTGDGMVEFATIVGELISNEVPIDGIGVLGEFGVHPPPIRVISDRLDQLASFDLPLVITAYDMETSDDRLQQDFTRDFLTLAFSHPSVEGFVFGQFWEEEDEALRAGIYRDDGAITAIGNVYRELVLGTWWTDIVALSNAEGDLTSRVFQGDYVISVRKDDQSATTTLSIGPKGGDVTLTLGAVESENNRAALDSIDQ